MNYNSNWKKILGFRNMQEKLEKKRSDETKGLLFTTLLLYKHGQRSLEEFIRTPLIFHHMKNNS